MLQWRFGKDILDVAVLVNWARFLQQYVHSMFKPTQMSDQVSMQL